MATTQGPPVGHEDIQAASGRTRWWVVALILGLPALLVIGFLAMVAIWVLTNDSSEAEQRPPHSLQVNVGDPWAGSTPASPRTPTM
ncbi:hypothetical protein ACOT81_28290 [Streptomyces sp. WI04-05B]|uniref:hypothetical protein n=1 Tax=Streptomyces TaxID=1883 RepID=UPI0029BE4661|nr:MULTISPECIES: hypothetical protein [unclassified Streptomyces]MDX2544424.1 hypothetical protein [Streptomyces sp. WI04-05B]MDX2588507.1 hypothetical protein [Streptomyces sp. WI04-05A]MDX3750566.1 hypothetical protein [Streptomyces sp. AK08-02]